MLKRKIFILIPLLLILAVLFNTWEEVAREEVSPGLRQYMALFLVGPLIWFFLEDLKRCIIFTGLYLVLATFYLIAITPYIGTFTILLIGSLPIPLPPMNGFALVILGVYLIFHFDLLSNYYLDYKESRSNKKKA